MQYILHHRAIGGRWFKREQSPIRVLCRCSGFNQGLLRNGIRTLDTLRIRTLDTLRPDLVRDTAHTVSCIS